MVAAEHNGEEAVAEQATHTGADQRVAAFGLRGGRQVDVTRVDESHPAERRGAALAVVKGLGAVAVGPVGRGVTHGPPAMAPPGRAVVASS